MRRIIWLYIIFLALLGACNFGVGQEPEDEYPPQTRIIRIELTPDTVATQDTVLIHCVIEDSADSKFKYSWLLGKNNILPVNGSTRGSYIRFVAPSFSSFPRDTIIVYSGSVLVDNGSSDSLMVSGDVNIPVLVK